MLMARVVLLTVFFDNDEEMALNLGFSVSEEDMTSTKQTGNT